MPREHAREAAAPRWMDRVREIVDSAPPLTPDQRDRLAPLLSGGAHDAAA